MQAKTKMGKRLANQATSVSATFCSLALMKGPLQAENPTTAKTWNEAILTWYGRFVFPLPPRFFSKWNRIVGQTSQSSRRASLRRRLRCFCRCWLLVSALASFFAFPWLCRGPVWWRRSMLLTLCFAEEPRVLVSINKPRDGMQEVPKWSFPLRGNPEVSWFLRRLLTD